MNTKECIHCENPPLPLGQFRSRANIFLEKVYNTPGKWRQYRNAIPNMDDLMMVQRAQPLCQQHVTSAFDRFFNWVDVLEKAIESKSNDPIAVANAASDVWLANDSTITKKI